MINTQISPLLTKESHHQWVLQQVANNEWKIMRSEIKLLYMINLRYTNTDLKISLYVCAHI